MTRISRPKVKAGGVDDQRSEATGLRVRTNVKAGGLEENHSESPGVRVSV